MRYDVKISGARIRPHDLWIQKRVCYTHFTTASTSPGDSVKTGISRGLSVSALQNSFAILSFTSSPPRYTCNRGLWSHQQLLHPKENKTARTSRERPIMYINTSVFVKNGLYLLVSRVCNMLIKVNFLFYLQKRFNCSFTN